MKNSLIDWASMPTFSFGLDRMLSDLQSFVESPLPPKFPPYNIRQIDNKKYIIEMAVAGYEPEDLDVEHSKTRHVLTISGRRKTEEGDNSEMIVQNLAGRNFKIEFFIGNYYEVVGSTLKNGMLTLYIEYRIPEELQPRSIMIGETAPVDFLPSPKQEDKAA